MRAMWRDQHHNPRHQTQHAHRRQAKPSRRTQPRARQSHGVPSAGRLSTATTTIGRHYLLRLKEAPLEHLIRGKVAQLQKSPCRIKHRIERYQANHL
jgi:ribosomal protein L3